MHLPAAAALAFFALGVTFFGNALLLIFNPRSRSVRWFVAFQLSIMVWLAAQGWALAVDAWARWGPLALGAVHVAPGLFIAFVLRDRGWSLPAALLPVAAAVALLPLSAGVWDPSWRGPAIVAWTVGAWTLGTVLFMRGVTRRERSATAARTAWWLVAGIAVVMPLGIAGGMLFGRASGFYFMPAAMVWIQLLLFVGVARARFYDIEVRAARTGDLAAAAAEQERLAVVGELAASLAHEIRNPLTGVRSLAQRLAEEEVDAARCRRYGGVILEEVGRVERLVANLLGLARRPGPAAAPEGPPVATPLEPLFQDLALLVSGRARRARVRFTTEAAGSAAAAPREALAQVLLNLLLNALAHAPEGSTVSLSARDADGVVEVAVRDAGPGIPAAERVRIWEPFHSGGGGTGLGLAVVRRVAREHGWTISVNDAPGGGAEFRLRMPAAAGAGDRRAPASAHAGSGA
jgi:signal transduction histidine kinase